MSAAYTKVEVTTESRSLRVRFRIENRSAESWSVPGGFRIGSQIIDPETNAYIEEGPRVAPGSDIAPGNAAEIDLELELPEHKGQYRVYVSPMREDAGWYYERGWPFLLLEVAVEAGRANLLRRRVLTLRRLRAAIFLRSLGRAFTYPVLNAWRNRGLIRSMVRRDILGRYRGSFGGVFWTLLNPLLLMLAYFFVFGIVLRARFAGDPSRSGFVLYFLAGMLPWLPFSEAAGRAPFVMMEHRNFVKRLVFPLETLPINVTVAGLVTQGFALVVFLALLVATRGAIPVSAALAAGAGGAAGALHAGHMLVSGRAGRLRARPRPCQWTPAHAVVLPDADLLPGSFAAFGGDVDPFEEPALRPGSGVPNDSARPRRRPRVRLALEALAVFHCRLHLGPRLVLQAPEDALRM